MEKFLLFLLYQPLTVSLQSSKKVKKKLFSNQGKRDSMKKLAITDTDFDKMHKNARICTKMQVCQMNKCKWFVLSIDVIKVTEQA